MAYSVALKCACSRRFLHTGQRRNKQGTCSERHCVLSHPEAPRCPWNRTQQVDLDIKTFRRGRDGLRHKQESFIETRAAFLLLALCHSWCRCALSFLWLTANSRVVKWCASCKCHAFKWTGFGTAPFLDYITTSLLNFSLFFLARNELIKINKSGFLRAPSPPGPSPC